MRRLSYSCIPAFRRGAITGPMPTGGTYRVEIAVCPIPALLAMKGHAIEGRYKQKDAFGQVDAWILALGLRN